jgi:hypothetical protein
VRSMRASVSNIIFNDEQINQNRPAVANRRAPLGQKLSGIVSKSFVSKNRLNNHRSQLLEYRINAFILRVY